MTDWRRYFPRDGGDAEPFQSPLVLCDQAPQFRLSLAELEAMTATLARYDVARETWEPVIEPLAQYEELGANEAIVDDTGAGSYANHAAQPL